MHKYYEQFENCREHDIPFCSDACPFKMDFLDIQQKLIKNKYNTAYKTIRNAVVFPDIVTALCPGYCEKACIRQNTDEAVRINMLEKTVMAKAIRKNPNEYNLPQKKGKVAVIGAGISGLGFAFRLASKKYDVTVYEKSDKIGGHLSLLLPEEVYLNEFDLQFKFEKYTLKLDSEVNNIDELAAENYDVIYIATGKGGRDFGLINEKSAKGCRLLSEKTAIFAGGSLCGCGTIHALADGINIARAAEIFIKTGTMEYPSESEPSRVVANEDLLTPTPPCEATDEGGIYTDEETVLEASRCIRCQCDVCQTHCDLVDFFGKWPISMRDEIIITSKPSKSLVHKNPAMRYINACTQCGLLRDTCPGNIDLCDMIKNARYKIHSLDKTPGAFRQYFIRDMEFANGEYAALKRPAPGMEKCTFAYFPGCNLGALDPDYVLESYKWLLSKDSHMGLLLRCCSVPVDWNGEKEIHQEEISKLRDDWEKLGKPTLVMACMSCMKHLREYLPEIGTISLYEVMAETISEEGFTKVSQLTSCFAENNGDILQSDLLADKSFSVFDPCSARNELSVQNAVRRLAASAGLTVTELPKGDKHGCCGFGGMGQTAAPDFTEHVAKKRMEADNNPYLVYCSNCRDIFTDRGKEAIHILDLLFGINMDNDKPQPNITERRYNRVLLKERLLDEIWGDKMTSKPAENKYKLTISHEIGEKINHLKILEEDICEVIENSQLTGRRTLDPQTGRYKAYKEIGHITCWVEYGINEGQYEVFNVYTHRMKIELEAVFNGKKIDM